MTQVADTDGQLGGVLGYTRHDRLYEMPQYENNAMHATKLKTPVKARSPQREQEPTPTPSPAKPAKPADQSPKQYFNHYTREELLKKIRIEQNAAYVGNETNLSGSGDASEPVAGESPVRHFFDFTVSAPATPDPEEAAASPARQVLPEGARMHGDLSNSGSSVDDYISCADGAADASASSFLSASTAEDDKDFEDCCTSASSDENEEEQNSRDRSFICDDEDMQGAAVYTAPEGEGLFESGKSSVSEVDRSSSGEADLRTPVRPSAASSPHTPLSDIKVGTAGKASMVRRIILESEGSGSSSNSNSSRDSTGSGDLCAVPIELGRYSDDGFNNELGGYDNYVPGVDGAASAGPVLREKTAWQLEQEQEQEQEQEREREREREERENEAMISMTLDAEALWSAMQSSAAKPKSAEEVMEEQLLQLSPLPCASNINRHFAHGTPPLDGFSGRSPAFMECSAGAFRLQSRRMSSSRPLSLPLYKPASSMANILQMERYNHLIISAAQNGPDAEVEAALLCSALDLCDEDIALHLRLAYLLNNM